MDIVNAERIKEFARYHPQSVSALERWELIVKKSIWKNFHDIRTTFSSADSVDGKIVFNIGGNNYRLIAIADYRGKQIIVRSIMTHAEYNRGKWKQ